MNHPHIIIPVCDCEECKGDGSKWEEIIKFLRKKGIKYEETS